MITDKENKMNEFIFWAVITFVNLMALITVLVVGIQNGWNWLLRIATFLNMGTVILSVVTMLGKL